MPQSIDVDHPPGGWTPKRGDSLPKGRHHLAEVPKTRQWRQMLFTLGSRLRTSLMSSDSACSSTTHSIGDYRREPLRPTSLDSALFYGVNSEDSEMEAGPDEEDEHDEEEEEEEEIDSNNSSGSYYERNFELSCRDEIFRDSAVFSEDAISQLSTELTANVRRTASLNLNRKVGLVDAGSIERTESGFAEAEDDVVVVVVEPKTTTATAAAAEDDDRK